MIIYNTKTLLNPESGNQPIPADSAVPQFCHFYCTKIRNNNYIYIPLETALTIPSCYVVVCYFVLNYLFGFTN